VAASSLPDFTAVLHKNGEKINEQFCCGNWKKFDLDADI